MKKKLLVTLSIILMISTLSVSAFALPKPRSAHYPRGGMLTLSSFKESNNTYAFKATGKADGKAVLSINGAYAETCETVVMIQMYVVNKWGNWIAFGQPEMLKLGSEPSSHEFRFNIRPKKAFCIVISSYGIAGDCVIPYQMTTI